VTVPWRVRRAIMSEHHVSPWRFTAEQLALNDQAILRQVWELNTQRLIGDKYCEVMMQDALDSTPKSVSKIAG
jgi:hypothetical protein